jgi:hypothetical protein
VVDSG